MKKLLNFLFLMVMFCFNEIKTRDNFLTHIWNNKIAYISTITVFYLCIKLEEKNSVIFSTESLLDTERVMQSSLKSIITEKNDEIMQLKSTLRRNGILIECLKDQIHKLEEDNVTEKDIYALFHKNDDPQKNGMIVKRNEKSDGNALIEKEKKYLEEKKAFKEKEKKYENEAKVSKNEINNLQKLLNDNQEKIKSQEQMLQSLFVDLAKYKNLADKNNKEIKDKFSANLIAIIRPMKIIPSIDALVQLINDTANNK